MRFTEFKNKPDKFAMHCGLCGFNIPLDRKYIYKLFQRKPTKPTGEIFGHQLYIGCTCPECGTNTDFDYWTQGDNTEFINDLNLYSETRKHNEDTVSQP